MEVPLPYVTFNNLSGQIFQKKSMHYSLEVPGKDEESATIILLPHYLMRARMVKSDRSLE
jgi:hypothetical protein